MIQSAQALSYGPKHDGSPIPNPVTAITSRPKAAKKAMTTVRPNHRGRCTRQAGQLAVAILLPLPGCGSAPSVNILGSFFPAWLICIVIGVVLTILTRQVFVAMKIASYLGPAPLVYPCLAGLWIFATWLLLFGS